MTYTYRQGRAAGFGLSRTSLGFRSFSVSSRKLKLLEFSNLPKTWVEGVGGREREREKKEYAACENTCYLRTFTEQIIGSHFA